jgi:hypothetical protein
VGIGRGDTRTADATRETPPCPLTLTLTHAHIKRGHTDHACIHPWLCLALDLRAHTGKKVTGLACACACACACARPCPLSRLPLGFFPVRCLARALCLARKWQVNHDDKMRKVVYDSGARTASDSAPGARMGGSVVRRDKVKCVMQINCAKRRRTAWGNASRALAAALRRCPRPRNPSACLAWRACTS